MTRIRFNALNVADMGVGILLNINVPMKYKNAVQTILSGFKAGNEYDIELHKEKRSLSANNYAWLLFDKLADKLHSTKEEVYRQAIGHVGVFDVIKIENPEALKRFKRIWRSNGEGWLTKTLDEKTVLAYYGSSTYDTKQMARLIDYAVDECKAQGIETKPQWEIDAMLKEWEKRG